MTVNELIHRLELVRESGWGDKDITVDAGSDLNNLQPITDVTWAFTDTVVITIVK